MDLNTRITKKLPKLERKYFNFSAGGIPHSELKKKKKKRISEQKKINEFKK